MFRCWFGRSLCYLCARFLFTVFHWAETESVKSGSGKTAIKLTRSAHAPHVWRAAAQSRHCSMSTSCLKGRKDIANKRISYSISGNIKVIDQSDWQPAGRGAMEAECLNPTPSFRLPHAFINWSVLFYICYCKVILDYPHKLTRR